MPAGDVLAVLAADDKRNHMATRDDKAGLEGNPDHCDSGDYLSTPAVCRRRSRPLPHIQFGIPRRPLGRLQVISRPSRVAATVITAKLDFDFDFDHTRRVPLYLPSYTSVSRTAAGGRAQGFPPTPHSRLASPASNAQSGQLNRTRSVCIPGLTDSGASFSSVSALGYLASSACGAPHSGARGGAECSLAGLSSDSRPRSLVLPAWSSLQGHHRGRPLHSEETAHPTDSGTACSALGDIRAYPARYMKPVFRVTFDHTLTMASVRHPLTRPPLSQHPQYNMSLTRTLRTTPHLRKPAPAPETIPPGYAVDASAGPMLRFEASLPRLPVPPLSSTAAKYLETVKPHLTAEEYSATQAAVNTFLNSDQAKVLQERLQARAADPNNKSWLSEWWNEVAYMGYRDPVVVFVSYFYVHRDDVTKPSQAKRAATLIKALLPFRGLVER